MKKKQLRAELADAISDVLYHGDVHEREWCGTWHAIEDDLLTLIESGTVNPSWFAGVRTRPLIPGPYPIGGVMELLDKLTVRTTTACKCGDDKCQK